MGPDIESLVKCFKCGSEFEGDLCLRNRCGKCGVSYSEAIGVEDNIIDGIYKFCQTECANSEFAFTYCSFQLCGVNALLQFNKNFGDKVFREAAIEVLQRIDPEKLFEKSSKCLKCSKYLLGHPNGRTVCDYCSIERKVWNQELGVKIFDV